MAGPEIRAVFDLFRPEGEPPGLIAGLPDPAMYQGLVPPVRELGNPRGSVTGIVDQATTLRKYIATLERASRVPVMDGNAVARFRDAARELRHISPLRLTATIIAATQYEASLPRISEPLDEEIMPFIDMQAVAYAAYAEARTATKEIAYSDVARRVDTIVREAETGLEKVEQLQGFGGALHDDLDMLKQALLREQKGVQDIEFERSKLDERISQTADKMEEFKSQVLAANAEASRLTGPQTLWAERWQQARKSVRFATILLAIALLGVPLVAICYLDSIAAGMRRFIEMAAAPTSVEPSSAEIAAYTVSRLVIVSVPLVVYFWIVRLAVRFWTRSLILLDDARMRDTTLQTYRRLIEENAAVTKEDRAIVLAAVCRPTPGFTGDADQPNIGEIVNNFSPKQ